MGHFHKKGQITVKTWRKKNGIYYCLSCCTVFPFQNISDDEFTFENYSVEDNYDLYKLKDNCLQFDINSFKYSDYNPRDFENDIDPDTNFYNNLTSKCEYYTDSKYTEKISKINGLSCIHFNARSLNKNFQKIKDYILELSLQIDIIAIWMELNLDDFNIDNDAYHITRGNRRGGGVVIYTANELSCKMVETKSFAVESILECVTVELAKENPKKVVVS